MKWLSIVLLGCMISACFAEVLITQDFEGATFPPAGWTVNNYPPIAYWQRYSDEHTNCAQCTVVTSGQSANLNTPNINLNSGDILNISFDSQVTNVSPTAALVALYQGTNLIWSDTCDRKKRSHNNFTLPAIDDSGSYLVRWSFPDVFALPPLNFFVDNVVISRNMSGNQAQIQPSSLGRIKSAYK